MNTDAALIFNKAKLAEAIHEKTYAGARSTDHFRDANCIPCRMPYITSMFMPRSPGDRPLPVPEGSKNLAFISQSVEIPDDVVFTVEYSVRAAQMAVYELMSIDRQIPPVTPHAESLHTQFEALIKAFK